MASLAFAIASGEVNSCKARLACSNCDLLGGIIQLDQSLTGLDLVTSRNIDKLDISGQTESHMGFLVGDNNPGGGYTSASSQLVGHRRGGIIAQHNGREGGRGFCSCLRTPPGPG